MDAAAPTSRDGSTVEPSDSTVEPSDSTVEPSDSTVEPSDSTAEPSMTTIEPNGTGVQPNVSPGSANDGPDPAATHECPDGCFITGTCHSSGDLNPSNACTACEPDSSNSQWSNVDGETCDDGLYCTVGDRCSAGKCVGDERACDDGVACNGAETCDETQEACASAESTCDEGQTCDVENDECSSTCNGCVIDGSCYSDGAVSPSNPCMVCDLSTSTNDWSVALAAACDDGDACTSDDRCNGAGACAGTPTVGGDCDCIDDSDCDDGVACTTDKCNDGTCSNALQAGSCRINEACVADGTADASNPCRYCDASSSQTGWTNSSPGASCDDGLWCNGADTCNAGSCTHEFPSGNRCTGADVCLSDTCDEDVRSCFLPSTTVCRDETETRCEEDDGCGSAVQARQVKQHCTGTSPSCTGAVVNSVWEDDDSAECAADQRCEGAGVCTAEVECAAWCDVQSGLCWAQEWTDRSDWQTAYDHCANLDYGGRNDWYLPSITDWISVYRGCTFSGETTGANVGSECEWSEGQTLLECTACPANQGPDDDSQGCYWQINLDGPCDSYWSTSVATPSSWRMAAYADSAWGAGNQMSQEMRARCVVDMQ